MKAEASNGRSAAILHVMDGLQADEIIFKKTLRSPKSGDKIVGSADNGSAKCKAPSADNSRKKVKNYLTRT
jgi:hypothetical protein